MKKSILITILFIALVGMELKAQEYRPMAVDGTHWIIKQVDGVNSWIIVDMWEYYCNGDTVINNIQYKTVYKRNLEPTLDEPPFTPVSDFQIYGFLRDDVIARKVYALLPESYSLECNTNEDFLLYDFSVEQGEPVVQCIMPSFYNAILDTIVNQEIHGVTTNVYQTSITTFDYYEGIGSSFGLFEDMFMPVKSTTELGYAQLYFFCPASPCEYVYPELTLLTIGEVFDFEVGDQFHYNDHASYLTPNGDRVTVTEKYYSDNLDTVFYHLEHNSYSSMVEMQNGEPVLIYSFFTGTDTVAYSNLNEPISSYNSRLLSEVYITTREEYCDSVINGAEHFFGPGGFPNEWTITEYGKGLGLVKSYYYYMGVGEQYDIQLAFYKKGNEVCGNPDVVSAKNHLAEQNIQIYPNPASDYIKFDISTFKGIADYKIYNNQGAVVQSGSVMSGPNSIDIKAIGQGIYFVKIIIEGKVIGSKFLKN